MNETSTSDILDLVIVWLKVATVLTSDHWDLLSHQVKLINLIISAAF